MPKGKGWGKEGRKPHLKAGQLLLKQKKNISCLNILFLNMTNFFRVFSQVLVSALRGSVKPVEMCSGLQNIN